MAETYRTPEGFPLHRPLVLPDVRSFTDLFDVVRPWDYDTMSHRNGVVPRPDLRPAPVQVGVGRAEISPFCAVRIDADHKHLAVVAKPIVAEAVRPFVFSDTVLGTEVILHRSTGRCLVVLNHQAIIASIYLAYIDPTTVPTGA